MSEAGPAQALHEIVISDLDREIASADALGTRAAAMVGFCGVILTLASTLGRSALDRDLGRVGDPLASGLLVAALIAICAAACTAASMLTPRQRGRVNPAVLRQLRHASDAEVEIYDRLNKSAVTLLAEEGQKNDLRGDRLRWGYRVLIVGLLLVAAQAAIVTLASKDQSCQTQTTLQLQSKPTAPAGSLHHPKTSQVRTISSTGCAKATPAGPKASSG